MKSILSKTLTTRALIVAMMTTAAAVQAQTVNINRYITLTVKRGKEIKLYLEADSNNTPVRIVSGSKTYNITVGTGKWTAEKKFLSDSTTMTVYGDIKGFHCGGNGENVTSIDVSHNTALTILYCYGNRFTSLDVSHNTALTGLYCDGNRLTSIDVSHNTALTILNCKGNKLTSLDVTNNKALTILSCVENQLTTLDVSHNTALTGLYCYGNNFSTATLDAIYCALPDRSGKEAGRIQPVYNASSANHATVLATTKGNATSKNWKVQYYQSNTDIPTTTGSYDCSSTSLAEATAAALTLYPNPVEDMLHIESEEAVRSIHIYNIYGTEVASATATTEIDLSGLPAGVYMVRVATTKGVATHKIVKR